jgi:hypothetical protein
MTDQPAPTSRTTPRKPTGKEMRLTRADQAFKELIIGEVEMKVIEIMPALVRAILKEELDTFIDDTVAAVNELEAKVNQLEGQS